MRAERRAPRLALLALLAAVSAGAEPPAIPQGPLTLEALMQRMSATSGVRAEFREEKTLALLETPLVSEGTLYFIPPSRMARITTRPGASKLVIDGQRMSYSDEAGASDVDLAGNRVARTIVENFVVLFAGDLAALRERYRVGFSAEGLRWRVHLTPKAAPLSQFLASVEMKGDGPALKEMAIREADGDLTVTRFQRVETDVHFTPEELARLFPPGPSAAAP
jgi:outer membrane lipoprotein-sorting protein